jgi:hypothetical protein
MFHSMALMEAIQADRQREIDQAVRVRRLLLTSAADQLGEPEDRIRVTRSVAAAPRSASRQAGSSNSACEAA